jgi:VanZ family protein
MKATTQLCYSNCLYLRLKMELPSRLAPVAGIRRAWLILGWALVALIIYLSLTPVPIQVSMELGDKYEHLLAYAVLMFWFANLYERTAPRVKLAIGFVAMGIALEFVQRWTGYRSFEVADMAAGAAGVAAGWIVAPPRVPSCVARLERLFER